jgi:hypothetical protein
MRQRQQKKVDAKPPPAPPRPLHPHLTPARRFRSSLKGMKAQKRRRGENHLVIRSARPSAARGGTVLRLVMYWRLVLQAARPTPLPWRKMSCLSGRKRMSRGGKNAKVVLLASSQPRQFVCEFVATANSIFVCAARWRPSRQIRSSALWLRPQPCCRTLESKGGVPAAAASTPQHQTSTATVKEPGRRQSCRRHRGAPRARGPSPRRSGLQHAAN